LYNIDFDFYLITHNSDYDINNNHLSILNKQNLIKWYAQNINFEHPKLFPIPIGLANDKWPHGNKEIFNKVDKLNIKKNILCYSNFDVNTNINERKYCLNNLPQEYIYPKTDFESYLTQQTIPIVKKSILTWRFQQMDLPLIIISDWNEIKNLKLNIDLYQHIISKNNLKQLNLNFFIYE